MNETTRIVLSMFPGSWVIGAEPPLGNPALKSAFCRVCGGRSAVLAGAADGLPCARCQAPGDAPTAVKSFARARKPTRKEMRAAANRDQILIEEATG